MPVRHLFPTPFYEDVLADEALLADLSHSARSLAADDSAGRRWCRDNCYPGYTSYASLQDLPARERLRKSLPAALPTTSRPSRRPPISIWAAAGSGWTACG